MPGEEMHQGEFAAALHPALLRCEIQHAPDALHERTLLSIEINWPGQ
jgi:hypothetical protein